MKTGMADGKMVYLDDKGQANPVLQANVGDTLEITIASGEGAEHDIVIPELNAQSPHFNAGTGPITLRFKVSQAGSSSTTARSPATARSAWKAWSR